MHEIVHFLSHFHCLFREKDLVGVVNVEKG